MLVCPCKKLFNLQLTYLTVNKKGELGEKKILEWQVFAFWGLILAFRRQNLAFESKILKNCN